MPIYTYKCQECGAQTDILRSYAAREENGRCGECAGLADYTGLCSPAIHSEAGEDKPALPEKSRSKATLDKIQKKAAKPDVEAEAARDEKQAKPEPEDELSPWSQYLEELGLWLASLGIVAKNMYSLGQIKGFEKVYADLDKKREEIYSILEKLKKTEE